MTRIHGIRERAEQKRTTGHLAIRGTTDLEAVHCTTYIRIKVGSFRHWLNKEIMLNQYNLHI